ncbi:RNA 2',3'-cyclic phosphodiesterase [Streptomyces boncukensis]|uniref:RNA 2',3'-cyclic phosphodiesterase n=1 Tax=Streptomyces boncukensis TaxID=2711219 RepID=A0A6G4WW51_9ACTN|nr:RNA 2',3'-cyclic phosphodiesterase [Streptomyces boncukensis]NGO69233.1 RNA 2',3'-cyclic phosphodiesterase [Streptomyces boncukensis]
MRLFAAVLPPPAATAELARAAQGLHALPGAERLRWTERAGWHLTLAFYGETDEAADGELRARLARAARRARPFALRLAGGGRFGDRALWAGLGEGSEREPLRRLAAASAAAGRRAGLGAEDPSRFRAHLTLARTSPARPVDLRPYAAALDGFTGEPWTVTELALVRSHAPAPGVPGARPRYETVDSWPLGPEPRPS